MRSTTKTDPGRDERALARAAKFGREGSESELRVQGTKLEGLARERKLHSQRLWRALRPNRAVAVAVLVVLSAGFASAEPAPELDVRGMTFVASRADENALILRAERARFDTEGKRAFLRGVDAEVPASDDQRGFRMWCDTSVVDLDTNDFEATGNVHGEADSGERFEAEWVRYDHVRGVLYTDAPVRIVDRGTIVEGGGFDYHIDSRNFQLRGGARLKQEKPGETPSVAKEVAR